MSKQYTDEQLDAMSQYQTNLIKLEQLENELLLLDYSEPRRYVIDQKMEQLEAWNTDLLANAQNLWTIQALILLHPKQLIGY